MCELGPAPKQLPRIGKSRKPNLFDPERSGGKTVLFPRGEEGWHTRVLLAGVNLANNANLQAHRRTHIEENEEESEQDDTPHRGRGGSMRVSQAQYCAFQLHNRQRMFSPIRHGGRLCQEYIVDAWVCVESNRFSWVRIHQAELRADCYNRLQDAMGAGLEQDAHRLSRQIILPSSISNTS